MGFSGQEYWSGLPFPPEDLPDPGIKSASPALTGVFFPLSHLGNPNCSASSTYCYCWRNGRWKKKEVEGNWTRQNDVGKIYKRDESWLELNRIFIIDKEGNLFILNYFKFTDMKLLFWEVRNWWYLLLWTVTDIRDKPYIPPFGKYQVCVILFCSRISELVSSPLRLLWQNTTAWMTYKQKNSFLTVLEARSLKAEWHHDWVLMKAPFWNADLPPCCVLTWWKGLASPLFSFTRALMT